MSEKTTGGRFICSSCGKDMVNPRTGAAFIGVHIQVDVSDEYLKESVQRTVGHGGKSDLEFYRRQLGAYSPELDDCEGEYKAAVCWECWLKSLGIPVPNHPVEGE